MQLAHIGIGLKVRIGLHHQIQAPQGPRQGSLRLTEPGDGRWIRRVRRRPRQSRHRALTGRDHRLQSLALVRQVTPGDLHQIGDQVMAALELHLDLGKGVTKTVAQGHQPVIDGNEVEEAQQGDRENDGGGEFHGFLRRMK